MIKPITKVIKSMPENKKGYAIIDNKVENTICKSDKIFKTIVKHNDKRYIGKYNSRLFRFYDDKGEIILSFDYRNDSIISTFI